MATKVEMVIEAGNVRMPAVIDLPAGKDLKQVFIISHGFRGSKEGGGRAVRLAEDIAGLGFTVIRYDFTPLASLSQQVAELSAVVNFARQRFSPDISLLGRSMGGSASLVVAAQQDNITRLCLWATPWNLHETFRLALGDGYDCLQNGRKWRACDEYGTLELTPQFINDFDKFDLMSAVTAIGNIPLLVLHGSDDEIVPVAQAYCLFQHACQPKKMVVIEGADHQFHKHAAEARAAVINWLSATIEK